MKNIIVVLISLVFLVGCDDLINPAIENLKDKESIYREPALAQGLLINGYRQLPFYESYAQNGGSGFSSAEIATDDGVTNNSSDQFRQMAAGTWSKSNNPIDMWTRCYNSILYLNSILDEADNMSWALDAEASLLFNMRIKGEAHALRALHMFYLLQAHAGKDEAGNLLGVPIIKDPAEKMVDFNLPRADFKTCIEFIYEDLQAAEDYLPLDYNDLDIVGGTGVIPQKYKDVGITSLNAYNRVMGAIFRQRMCGRIVEAIRAKVALFAASPAYLNGTDNSWAKAAEYAAVVLNRINGPAGLAPKGLTWYTDNASTAAGINPPEIIWRHRTRNLDKNSAPEVQLYPPTLYGNGWINPSQNLVDAFPTADGYPIAESSTYDSNNPYDHRDPRLGMYIVVHNSQLGPSSATRIDMTSTDDAVGALAKSTRTGYYLRKFVNPATNLTPNGQNFPTTRYIPRIRYTEIFLIYAEAAFEAAKSFDGKASNASYSAYDVIRAIRGRAKVGGSDDPYLTSIKGDESKVRELIHNERQLELCFEGHRFYDLRRWMDMEKLNEPIRGIKSSDGNFDFTGPYVLENERIYKDYMYYGPIPYNETKKWSNLVQNKGWD